MTDWKDVGQVLLGSWPSQVAAWGREGIAAYMAELKARGLAPEAAIMALRRNKSAFPPSAGEVAGAGRSDPSTPTFEEMLALVYRVASLEPRQRIERLEHHSQLVARFVELEDRIFSLPLDDPEYGSLRRKELAEAWGRFLEVGERRQVAAIASGGEPRRLDPVSTLTLGRATE